MEKGLRSSLQEVLFDMHMQLQKYFPSPRDPLEKGEETPSSQAWTLWERSPHNLGPPQSPTVRLVEKYLGQRVVCQNSLGIELTHPKLAREVGGLDSCRTGRGRVTKAWSSQEWRAKEILFCQECNYHQSPSSLKGWLMMIDRLQPRSRERKPTDLARVGGGPQRTEPAKVY